MKWFAFDVALCALGLGIVGTLTLGLMLRGQQPDLGLLIVGGLAVGVSSGNLLFRPYRSSQDDTQ
jgi:hypothetical protein